MHLQHDILQVIFEVYQSSPLITHCEWEYYLWLLLQSIGVLYIFLYIYLGFSEKLPVIQFPCWIACTVFGDLFPNTCQATNTKRLQEKATDFIIL